MKLINKEIVLTVVTVVYNDVKGIRDTLESVLNQTRFDKIEYIIIDGESTDGTKTILEEYKQKIRYIISEKDDGIYEAMNKAIDLASGDWIIFMNSGDKFYDNEVVNEFLNIEIKADIVYGKMLDPKTHQIIEPRELSSFWLGMPFNHQSTFTKTHLYKTRNYDLDYPISSVYDFYYYYFKKGVRFDYLDIIVAKYDMSGISAYSFKWLIDYWKIVRKYSDKTRLRIFIRMLRVFISRSKSNLKRLIYNG